MRNVFTKSNIMNGDRMSEIFVNIPVGCTLDYNYECTKALSQARINYKQNYLSRLFKYEGVKFNMIPCPSGGIVETTTTAWVDKKNSYEEIKITEVHTVNRPFLLGENEVTQELFEAVMGFNYSNIQETVIKKTPIVNVTWYDCVEFCNRLSDYFGLDRCYELRNKQFSGGGTYSKKHPLSIKKANPIILDRKNGFRLPREWEWQIAAMAGTNNKYSGTNDNSSLGRFAWGSYNAVGNFKPVSHKLPNEWGFYDMSGNVEEWCENTPILNTDINDLMSKRVTRGGGWHQNQSGLTVFSRANYDLDYCNRDTGFRIAKTI